LKLKTVRFDLEPGTGVGPISFGMPCADVKTAAQALGDVEPAEAG
jgi:hypothetical protein